ncbi:hypothetical protein EDB80DRAFT_112317 [Ilyonectria destructans]|nr:hypothetical protein EDB80DRAFT_112317 [Ilyonectria destructans]
MGSLVDHPWRWVHNDAHLPGPGAPASTAPSRVSRLVTDMARLVRGKYGKLRSSRVFVLSLQVHSPAVHRPDLETPSGWPWVTVGFVAWPVDRPLSACSGPCPPDRNEMVAAACRNGTPPPSASSTRDDESLLGMDTIQANIGQDFHTHMHTGKETHKSRNLQVHICVSLSKTVPHVAAIRQTGSCASPSFRARKGQLNCVASSSAHQAQATSPHQSTDGTRRPNHPLQPSHRLI